MSKLVAKFIASNYTNQITYRKITAYDQRNPRGTFHDTWEEAHAVILAKRKKEVADAERDLRNRKVALKKVQAMKPPATQENIDAS